MNERARELVEQAGMVYWPNKQLDKFAELIVKEVFAKIEDERFEVYQPVKEAVMKHFGIE
jgi:hypothetical protein